MCTLWFLCGYTFLACLSEWLVFLWLALGPCHRIEIKFHLIQLLSSSNVLRNLLYYHLLPSYETRVFLVWIVQCFLEGVWALPTADLCVSADQAAHAIEEAKGWQARVTVGALLWVLCVLSPCVFYLVNLVNDVDWVCWLVGHLLDETVVLGALPLNPLDSTQPDSVRSVRNSLAIRNPDLFPVDRVSYYSTLNHVLFTQRHLRNN